MEITAGVQGNYSNFKQKLAEKENFVISKVNERQPLSGNCHLRAAGFQKMTTWALSKKIRIWKQNFLKSNNFFSENSTKTFFAQPEGHMNNEEILRVIRKHLRQFYK